MELNEMKIQFLFKETKQFCSQPNLGQNAITTTFGPYCKNINFWGHFVKTQESTTSCNYNQNPKISTITKTSLKEQNNLSFSDFGPLRKNVNFRDKVQIHKSIKTLCNCIKAPKVPYLQGWQFWQVRVVSKFLNFQQSER